MYFLAIRRFFKWNFARTPRREKTQQKTFSDTLSDLKRLRKRCMNLWMVIFLLAPGLYYYLFNKILQENNTQIIDNMNVLESYPIRTYIEGSQASALERIQHYPKKEVTQSTKAIQTIQPNMTPNIQTTPGFRLLLKLKENNTSTGIPTTTRNNYYSSKLPLCVKRNTSENVKIIPILPTPNQSYQDVQMGGFYRPKNCKSKHKVAFLVPYRDRETNLAIFIFNIHSFLIKQNLEYRIFVLEQWGKSKFNKGALYNAGFKEIQKYGIWSCVVFHDVDLLPLDTRIKYSCPVFPRHMCGVIIEKQKIHENSLFGGVTQMSLDHYRLVNGYSNNFWGWGGEDHNMFWRLQYARLPILRYNKTISHYAHVSHSRGISNPERYNILGQYLKKYKTEWKFRKEGLSTVLYEVKSMKLRHLYTHIVINLTITENDQRSQGT